MQSRYHRQVLLKQIGAEGQACLSKARVAIVGLGALGTVVAETLVRAGVGYVRLIDNDKVSLTNLQRVALYTEADAEAQLLKVVAATQHLEAINSSLAIEPLVGKLDAYSALDVLTGVDLIIDGTDNLEARHLINEAANKLFTPWIYTGVFATVGMLMPITPAGPCFKCLNAAPRPEENQDLEEDSAILGTTSRLAATMEANLALQLLLNTPAPASAPHRADYLPQATLMHFDIWEGAVNEIIVEKDPECCVCSKHVYELLA